MSKSKLCESRKSTPNQNKVQFRKLIHQRSDHQNVDICQIESNKKIHTQFKMHRPTQSRLESSLQLYKQRSKQSNSKLNASFHLDKINSRNSAQPSNNIKQNRVSQSQNGYVLFVENKLINPQHNQQRELGTSKSKSYTTRIDTCFSQPRQIQSKGANGLQQKIDDIENKLHKLITKKLQFVFQKMNRKNGLNTLNSLNSADDERVQFQMLKLINEIKNLKAENSIKGDLTRIRNQDFDLLNTKITFLQTLMAGNITQAELLKKYYFSIFSNSKRRGKIGDFHTINYNTKKIHGSQINSSLQKLFFKSQNLHQSNLKQSNMIKSTTNKQTYKSPNLEDYQTYRYKHKNVSLNLQPLPRSSYKREFLHLKSLPNESFVNHDHAPFFPNMKPCTSSIYGNDYKNVRAEIINHKELDAYKNKLKFLKVNYSSENRHITISDKTTYFKDIEQKNRPSAIPKSAYKYTKLENTRTYLTQAKRQFAGQAQLQKSSIKHKQLTSFQYKLKNLYKA